MRMETNSAVYSQALEEQLKLAGHTLYGHARERLAKATNATSGILAMLDNDAVMAFYRQQLLDADPFFWSAKLCNLLEQVAPQIPDWTLTISSLPSEAGFIWFEKPLRLPRTPAEFGVDEACPLAALSWSPIAWKHTPGQPSRFWGMDTWEGADQIWLILSAYVLRNEIIEPVTQMSILDGESLSSLASLDAADDPISDPNRRVRDWSLNIMMYFASAVSFMEQRILVSERQQPHRGVRRRLPPFARGESAIRVVLLRRRDGAIHSENQRDVDWSCQWLVSGHWRQQWYAKTQAHKPKYIMPYVKGPEGKPLKPPTSRIFVVVR